MVRAVLDSSALVSAFLTPKGPLGTLLRKARSGAFSLHLSPEIIAETAHVLRREVKLQQKYRYGEAEVAEFCDGLATSDATLVTELPDLSGAVPLDPKDDKIVATAVAAKADYLVTGDRRHLRKRRLSGTLRVS